MARATCLTGIVICWRQRIGTPKLTRITEKKQCSSFELGMSPSTASSSEMVRGACRRICSRFRNRPTSYELPNHAGCSMDGFICNCHELQA
jgi:hypothetical protein